MPLVFANVEVERLGNVVVMVFVGESLSLLLELDLDVSFPLCS